MSRGTREDCAHCQEELRRAMTSCSRHDDVTGPRCYGSSALRHAEGVGADHRGDSPLIVAVRRGFTLAVRELLRTEGDVHSKNQDSRTALHYAAKAGDVTTVQLLLSHGARVDARDDYCFTPLMLCCRQGHDAVARCLVQACADVNAVNDVGETALFYAAKDRSFRTTDKCAEVLIGNGAKIEHRNNTGCSALHLAVMFEKTNIVKMLLSQNCQTDYYGKLSFVHNCRSVEMNVMPLEVAFLTGSYDICAMLIACGGDAKILVHHVENGAVKATDVPDWLRDAIYNPMALLDICRSRVRQSCVNTSRDVIGELPLPKKLISYLLIPELQVDL